MKYLLIFPLVAIILIASIRLQSTLKPKSVITHDEPIFASNAPTEQAAEYSVSAWIADYDTVRAIEAFSENSDSFEEIMPVVFKLDEDLSVDLTDFINVDRVQRIAQEGDIKVIASISNELDGVRVHRFLNNKEAVDAGVDKIVEYLESFNFDGIDLDFENIPVEDRENYVIFIRSLRQKLGNKKKLSVAVHAQIVDQETGQNLVEIGKLADTVRVMAYDFHSTETGAGSIIGIDTLQKVLDISSAKIPTEKIALCLPTYGYDWSNNNAYSMQYNEIEDVILNHPESNVKIDLRSHSKHLVYYIGKVKHDVWFEDAETLARKIDFAKKYDLRQFCFWRLGGEDTRIWEIF